MASPYKQISHRRFPPFPGSRSSRRFTGEPPSPSLLSPDSGIRLDEIHMDSLKMYIAGNPDILEELVLESVNVETIASWIKKKKKSTKPATPDEVGLIVDQPIMQEKFLRPDVVSIQNELLDALNRHEDILPHLAELMDVIGTAIRSDGVTMYAARSGETELCLYVSDHPGKYHLGMKSAIAQKTTVAAHAAHTKQTVLVKDLQTDERFPNGIGVEDSLLNSIICVPFTLPTSDLICVMQFGRSWLHPVFGDSELQLVTAITGWAGMALHQQKIANQLHKQAELNDFLLEVSKLMFNDIVDMDILIEKIMTHAKELVQADRCALFLVDESTAELYANLFDEGLVSNGNPVFTRKPTLRFSMEKGIAGLVARTSEVVNIKNAYADPRFNREIDRQTGYTTFNILCMPIISRGSVLGVIQMINKKTQNEGEKSSANNGFTQTDEAAFKMFAVYCALAMHYSKVYAELQHKTAENTIVKDIMTYHSQCLPAEAKYLTNHFHPKEAPLEIDSFYFYGPSSHNDQLSQLFVHMLDNLLGPDLYNKTKLCNFLATIKRNYRPVAYHNWQHAFNVAHCMYCILLRLSDTGLVDHLRMQALMIGSLCHDIDHRGYNNAFYTKYTDPMAYLYPSSVLETHHFYTTIGVLEREENNIFEGMDSDEYEILLNNMRQCILATDLALYFGKQKELSEMVVTHTLDLSNPDHIDDVISLTVTACDLCAVCKSWEDHITTIDDIYTEFYQQGDLEKLHGDTPIAMMDRANIKLIPKDQVGFFKFVCIPCYQTLSDIIPEASDLLAGCRDNLEQWERMLQGKSTKVWEPAKSVAK